MTTTQTRRVFDLTGELPSGTQVIEASAGTGKTYALVGLAARFIAERDVAVSKLMLVTFSQVASQELRDRTRDRFRSCAAALVDPASARTSKDTVIAHLATGNAADVELRRTRLLRALSDFDAATIVTTHSFCQRMLDGIGIAGDYQPEATFREGLADLVGEVGDDLYVTSFSGQDDPTVSVRDARTIAADAVGDPQARLAPTDAPEGSVAASRVTFAQDARAEVTRRKRIRAVRDYDDLLTLLAGALGDPAYGPTARERIRSRYDVVLVDEFQDTDPIQWEILRLAFHTAVTLILVGDPKQAIYAFRGADVMTYIDASAAAGDSTELTVNYRTDHGVLRALDRLFGGAALGPDQITVGHVDAHHQHARLGGRPLRLRYLDRVVSGGTGTPTVGVVRPHIAEDVANDIVATLTSSEEILHETERRPLQPSDFAVLVRNRAQGTLIRNALARANVPCVLTGGSSVFSTPAATAWQRVLAALAQPHRSDRIRLAALTPIVGFTAHEIVGDGLAAALSAQLRSWAEVFTRSGLAAMFEVMVAARGTQARLLEHDDGERTLTDLRHLAQLMNREVTDAHNGLASLSTWLAHRMDDEKRSDTSERNRLLDSESRAVRVLTIHAAKGLEFPIVYLPFGWDTGKRDAPTTLLLHEGGHRVRDVGGDTAPDYAQRLAVHHLEDAGEELRLFYVAATRAQSRIVAWWAPTRNTRPSPLHRLLFGRTEGQPQLGNPVVPADGVLADRFTDWAAPVADVVAIEAVPQRGPVAVLAADPIVGGDLAVARFDRVIDWSWRRMSYSWLTDDDRTNGNRGEAAEVAVLDEEGAATLPRPGVVGDTPSLMNDLPSGTAFGTLVHQVLQFTDTSAQNLAAEVRARTSDAAANRMMTVDVDALATALTAVMTSPIPGGTLAGVLPRDRLPELTFEYPLAGGDDTADTAATLGGIADLLAAHLLPTDPLVGYPARLRMIPDATLRGYLTGSIDDVLRFTGPRYVILDYKTNKTFTGPSDASQFDTAAMAAEMMHHHYPLQAMLYSVALHRYLRWRQPGYRPEEHLGGVLYLFLRGMVGEQTPPGCGVFQWHPSPALIVALSDLLAAR
jgi:exodeoxyribonuclease V beta subunit